MTVSNKIVEGRAVRAGLKLLEAEETRLDMIKATVQEGIDSGISERTPEEVRSGVRQRLANSGRLPVD